MRVGTVELHDFRSYVTQTLTFEPGINTILGPNGIGKTNLIEAVGYLSTLRSHRVAADLPLVRRGAQQAIVRAEIIHDSRSSAIEIAIVPGRANRIQISGSVVRPSEVVGHFKTVSFTPEDLGLVKGDPAERRRFLDDLLVQRAPRYVSVRSEYERVVRQRTALLRSLHGGRTGNADANPEALLRVWDEKLATTGAALLFGRLSLLNEVSDFIEEAYSHVAPGKRAVIAYDPRSLTIDEAKDPLPRNLDRLVEVLQSEIDRRRADEIARGVTLVGPHRDDLFLEIDQLPAKGYASHGECWSLALALRLGGFELMRGLDDGSGDPVLILDDVFAELDQSRRAALAEVAVNAEQVLITAAVPDDVPLGLRGARYNVSAGEVTRD